MHRYDPQSDFFQTDRKSIGHLFPLYPNEEFDSCFVNVAWPVAFRSKYPEEVKSRIFAALLSMQFGLKSIDYTLKNYVRGIPQEEPVREDIEVADFLKKSHSFAYDLVHRLTHHSDDCVGRILAEWALLRLEFSFFQLLTLANRGALFEGLTVARMQLEQLAWICAIDREPNPEKVKNTQAQSSLSKLRHAAPAAGRLYGYLSNHAHWSSSAHVRAMATEGERLGVVFASSRHKIELYIILLLILDVQIAVIFYIRKEEISALDDAQDLAGTRDAMAKRIDSLHKMLSSHLDIGNAEVE